MIVGGEGANPTVAVLIGITAAAIAGALVTLLLAWLGIRWKVDQIIAGIVINIGALGITNFLFLRVLSKNTELNSPPTVESLQMPFLSQFPVLGPIMFTGTPYLYFTLVVMLAFAYMLFSHAMGTPPASQR